MGTNQDPRITSRTAKDKIFEAYEAMKAQRDKLRAGAIDVDAVAKSKQTRVQADKREQVESIGGFVQSVDQFNTVANNMLKTLRYDVEKRADELALLESTITEKKDLIKDLSGIEAEVGTLAALLQTRTELDDRLRLEREAAVREHQAEMAKITQEQIEKQHMLQAAIVSAQEAFSTNTERKQAEWEYAFKRECQEKRDGFNDELKEKSTAHNEEINAELASLAEREAHVVKREEAAEVLEKQRDALEVEVAGLKANESAAIQKAVEEANASAVQKREAAINVIRQQYEARLKVETERVGMRDEQVTALQASLAAAQADLKDAQARINDLALKSIDASHAIEATKAIRNMAEQTTVAASKGNAKN